MSDQVKIDPVTGRAYRRGLRRVNVEYMGLTKEIESPGWWPDDGENGEGILVGSDMDAWDAALEELKYRVSGRRSDESAPSPAAE